MIQVIQSGERFPTLYQFSELVKSKEQEVAMSLLPENLHNYSHSGLIAMADLMTEIIDDRARANYFIGNDPKKWRTDIPTYAAVIYQEAYKGIDLKF